MMEGAGKETAALVIAAVKADVLPEVERLRLEIAAVRGLIEKLLKKKAVLTFEDK